MNSGIAIRRMWGGKDADPVLPTCENQAEDAILIRFALSDFKFPVTFRERTAAPPKRMTLFRGANMNDKLNAILKKDPMEELTKPDMALIWNTRYELARNPEMLVHVLASVDFTVPAQVQEVPWLLEHWEPPEPTQVLSLLDSSFSDPYIRRYAVQRLERMADSDVMLYMLQLVQALKYELYDGSPLASFLVRRGLQEPRFVGHQLFWQLISEAHLSHIQRRFSGIVVNFLYGLGATRQDLLSGYQFTQKLVELHGRIRHLSYIDALEPFRLALEQIHIPPHFHLPMDPRLVVRSLVISKCKVMDSKKKPFWLEFENAAPYATDPVLTMFKVGDDLRQDQLTLQVMKVMEHLWRKHGLDFQMRCYAVLPTGLDQGFIEVVPNAQTESQIQMLKGVSKGPLDRHTITDYLKEFHPTNDSFLHACHLFKLSSAGYAVATCVLGIGDRHPSNIMVQRDGHYFHVDFGHFLGNFKSKLGIQREKTPFHFSAACDYAIKCAPAGDSRGTPLPDFEELCGRALNILRHEAKLLVSLFFLMLGTGLPELEKPADIRYLRDKLLLHMTDDEAKAEFARYMQQAVESKRTTLNNIFHNLQHSRGSKK
jgi:phosphatidylinositol-4,5-bisphosphate 3-kinase